ncbi:MAG: hypothetical protein WCQ89_10620, partial [Verrucomicrobiota bacterium]
TKPPKAKRGQKPLVWRDVSPLFGHEDLVLLQRKGRFELPHVRAFRELVEVAYRAESKNAPLQLRPQIDRADLLP